MAANPPLVRAYGGELMPAPFAGEVFMLSRKGIEINLDNVITRNGRWNARGVLFMSQIRFVFVASKPDQSGLQAFDIPLVYIANESFNQPIFGCNNLSFRCFPVGDAGGPQGSLPPHDVKLSLREGGCGTLLPIFFAMMGQIRTSQQQIRDQAQAAAAAQSQPPPAPARTFVPEPAVAQQHVQTAYVDPNDPTVLYVTQPVGQDQVMGDDSKPYEPTGLKP